MGCFGGGTVATLCCSIRLPAEYWLLSTGCLHTKLRQSGGGRIATKGLGSGRGSGSSSSHLLRWGSGRNRWCPRTLERCKRYNLARSLLYTVLYFISILLFLGHHIQNDYQKGLHSSTYNYDSGKRCWGQCLSQTPWSSSSWTCYLLPLIFQTLYNHWPSLIFPSIHPISFPQAQTTQL